MMPSRSYLYTAPRDTLAPPPAATAGRDWPAAAVRNWTRPVEGARDGLPPDLPEATGTDAMGAGAAALGRASAGV